jgi:hypothetical protein
VLRGDLLENDSRERLLREPARRLSHPGIVAVYDTGDAAACRSW